MRVNVPSPALAVSFSYQQTEQLFVSSVLEEKVSVCSRRSGKEESLDQERKWRTRREIRKKDNWPGIVLTNNGSNKKYNNRTQCREIYTAAWSEQRKSLLRRPWFPSNEPPQFFSSSFVVSIVISFGVNVFEPPSRFYLQNEAN